MNLWHRTAKACRFHSDIEEMFGWEVRGSGLVKSQPEKSLFRKAPSEKRRSTITV